MTARWAVRSARGGVPRSELVELWGFTLTEERSKAEIKNSALRRSDENQVLFVLFTLLFSLIPRDFFREEIKENREGNVSPDSRKALIIIPKYVIICLRSNEIILSNIKKDRIICIIKFPRKF